MVGTKTGVQAQALTSSDIFTRPWPVAVIAFSGQHRINKTSAVNAASHGDGWIILAHKPDAEGAAAIDRLRSMVNEVGRPNNTVGADAWVSMGGTTPDDWRSEIEGWKKLGATHVTLNTVFERQHHRRIEATTVEGHLKAIELYMSTIADLVSA